MLPTRGIGSSTLIATGGLGPWVAGAPIIPVMVFLINGALRVARIIQTSLRL